MGLLDSQADIVLYLMFVLLVAAAKTANFCASSLALPIPTRENDNEHFSIGRWIDYDKSFTIPNTSILDKNCTRFVMICFTDILSTVN